MGLKPTSAPDTVVLAITNKCNLSCKHCMIGERTAGDDFTQKELFGLIDELVRVKVFTIGIFGGEPFCRSDIFKIIDYIHAQPVAVDLNTNATMITREIASRLAAYRKLRNITVSFDGSSPVIMNALRGEGVFQKAYAGIENLLKTGKFNILLSVTVTKYNFRDINMIAQLGKRMGVGGVRYNDVFFGGNAACNVKDIMLTPQERREALQAVKETVGEFGNFISGSYPQSIEIIEGLKKKEIYETDTISVKPCGAAIKKCCITADGWVVPCEIMWDLRAGNIRERSFLDIWQNSEVMRSLREDLVYSLKGHVRCIGCRYVRLCYQGHRCSPYFYTQGLKPEEVNCIIDRG